MEQFTGTVYGVFYTPGELEQQRQDKINGIVRFHPRTYMEYEVPEEIEKELCAIVEARLKQFHNICTCEACKNERLNPSKYED